MKTYQPGKMGLAEGIAFVYGMLMARILITSIANQIQQMRQIFWLEIILYGVIAFAMLFMIIYVMQHAKGDFFAVCQALMGRWATAAILSFYIFMFFSNSALLLRQYTEYTLVTALPRVDFQIVVLWYAITVGLLCYLGIEPLARTGLILLPFLVLAVIAVFVLLSPNYVYYRLFPWQGSGIIKVVKESFTAVGYDIGVLPLIFFSSSFQSLGTLKRTVAYSLSGTILLKVGFVFSYILAFGTNVGAEKSMPFYEMVRLVYLSEFIQRIEALFIVVWVFTGVLAIAASLYSGLYLAAVLFRLPSLREFVPLGVIIITNLAMMPMNLGAAIRLDSSMLMAFNFGMYGIAIMLFILLFLRNRRKKPCVST